jgi:hypothetical protein
MPASSALPEKKSGDTGQQSCSNKQFRLETRATSLTATSRKPRLESTDSLLQTPRKARAAERTPAKVSRTQ